MLLQQLSAIDTNKTHKDLLKEAGVNATSAGVSIPASASLLRILEFPAVAQDKLKEMVPIEVRKYIPVPISEVLLDWQVLPKTTIEQKEDDKTCEVLVAAIHNDVIERYKEIMTKSGLQATFFEIEVFSTARAVLDKNREATMIVDVGAATTKVYVIERGVVRATRVINAGSQSITLTMSNQLGVSVQEAEEAKRQGGTSESAAAEGILNGILGEAASVKSIFEEQNKKEVSKVVFAGGGTIISGLVNRAYSVFEVEVVMADPFSRLEAQPVLEPVLKKAGPELAVAIGLVLRKLGE